jgi:hypothetical protein
MPEEEITLKNTKAEILEALERALRRAEAAEKGKLNPEKEEREVTEKKAVKSAREAVEQQIFSKALNDKFNDLQTAISSEERRLNELYGIENQIQKLALAIEGGRDKIAEIEAEKSAKEAAAKESLKALNTQFEQKSAELQSNYDDYVKKLKTDRLRENEEYQYALTRGREKENNAWADEKRARENELGEREARAAKMLAEAEAKAEYVKSLEEKSEGFAKLVETEKGKAVAAAVESLTKEHEHQKALMEMTNKNTVDRLTDKAAFREKEAEASNKAFENLQSKLDRAYSEIRDLATKTVESAGGVKIIGNPEKNNNI